MNSSIINPNKKSRRGRPSADTEQIGIRMEREVFEALDRFRAQQTDLPQRTEAIRRIVRERLTSDGYLDKSDD